MSDYVLHPLVQKELKFGKGNGVFEYEDLRKEKKTYCVQEKYDGARFMLVGTQGGHQLRSRVVSRKTEELGDKTTNFPHLKINFPGLVLDGEIMAADGLWTSMGSAVLSKPEKSVAWQKANGWVKYVAFDILFLGTKDMRSFSYHYRRKILREVVTQLGNKHIGIAKTWTLMGMEACRLFKTIIKGGGEGIMVKDSMAPYGKGVWKVKSFRDTNVIITGYTEGQGKYDNQIGAVKFSVYDKGELVEIGQCSGLTDPERIDFTRNKKKYIGKVIQVRGNQISKHGRLRHPRFMRHRSLDSSPESCTMKKLQEDFS